MSSHIKLDIIFVFDLLVHFYIFADMIGPLDSDELNAHCERHAMEPINDWSDFAFISTMCSSCKFAWDLACFSVCWDKQQPALPLASLLNETIVFPPSMLSPNIFMLHSHIVNCDLGYYNPIRAWLTLTHSRVCAHVTQDSISVQGRSLRIIAG